MSSIRIYRCDHCRFESTVSCYPEPTEWTSRSCPQTNCNGTQSPLKCSHGHTAYRIGCVSCVLVFQPESAMRF